MVYNNIWSIEWMYFSVLCEFSDSGEVLREYLPGVCFIVGGSVYFYHFDRLGSVRFLTDGSGNIVQEYSYDAWGNLVSGLGSISQPYQYLSYYSEVDIGLYLTGKKWYDPKVGRYISRNSPYLFSNNNPITSKDIGSLRIVDRNVAIYIPPSEQQSKKGFYGNWCGRGWSGGKYTDDPKEVDWSVPAIDSIDRCCKFHDWCVQRSKKLIDKVKHCSELMCICLESYVKECDKNKNPEAYKSYQLMKKLFCEIGGIIY